MTKVQRYKVGYYTDEWGMSSNTPCLVPDDSGYAVKFEDYCKLEAELTTLKAENEWQPIETAPKDGTVVLVGRFVDDGQAYCNGLIAVDWYRGPDMQWGMFSKRYWPATHWMPLPKPPAMAQVREGEQ